MARISEKAVLDFFFCMSILCPTLNFINECFLQYLREVNTHCGGFFVKPFWNAKDFLYCF